MGRPDGIFQSRKFMPVDHTGRNSARRSIPVRQAAIAPSSKGGEKHLVGLKKAPERFTHPPFTKHVQLRTQPTSRRQVSRLARARIRPRYHYRLSPRQ